MSLECLDVTLHKTVYHKTNANDPAGVPFLIGKTTSGQSIKGPMRKPVELQTYRLWGDWQPQKGYEPAFVFVHHEPIVEQSESGFAQYLSTFVDGLGPIKSRAIVDEYGMDSLKVLRENPDDALKIKGITPEIVESIRNHFAENQQVDPIAYSKLIELFKGHKIPKRIIRFLLRDWGSDAPAKVQELPYMLLAYPGLGWKTVDAFALSVGYPQEGQARHVAALVEAMEKIAGDGHTVASRTEVNEIAFSLVGGLPNDEAWTKAENDRLIVHNYYEDNYSLPKIAEAERTIAERLALLARTAIPLPFSLDDDGLLAGQQAAMRLVEQHGVVVVSGAPGVGKTHAVTKAISGCVKHGLRGIRFVAPTGKAAKRAAELLERALPGSGIVSSTVHRALGPIPSQEPEGVPSEVAKSGRGRGAFTFSRNEENPIEAQIIVCDEASMLDVLLGADLLRAIAPGTRLIFVGDPNQLPSVGAGSVLRDMIDAGIPTATLTEVQRNCGTIVRACHDILKGKPPTPADKVDLDAGNNWIHVELSKPEEIAETIVNLHKSTKTFDPVWDMQVISPEKAKAGVGCNNLNRLLSDALNTWKGHHQSKADDDEQGGYEPSFVCGDKVVRTKNGLCDLMTVMSDDDDDRPDWTWGNQRFRLSETDIVNGDMGDVVDICKARGETYVVVDFVSPRRRCRLPFMGNHLIAAYAMTCHKAQGSGFPYVVLPVHNSFFYDEKKGIGMWNREMIYTLFSRAERFLVTVGPRAAIESAVKRPTVGRRQTRLKSLIQSPSRILEVFEDVEAEIEEILANVEQEEFADV
ncbi:AAA family ATPase [Singulisphaera sp. Ch08]|uniref:AAA family ATPase n=1 Tax=Singulisphaera sp. Ch08 TaxID=3120278 RepID=A0AAU7CL00_9BACT